MHSQFSFIKQGLLWPTSHMCQDVHQLEATLMYTSQAFNNKSNLNTHVKQVHNNEKSYSCMLCGKGFFRRDWQIDHEIRKHSSKRKAKVLQIKYFCKYCNKAFRRKGNLIRHENSQVHPRARLIH